MGYREACNECHYRKVRCEQAASGGACLNCQNQGKECVYGTTRRMGRPKYKSQRRRTESSVDGATGTASPPPTSETTVTQQPGTLARPHSESHINTTGDVSVDPRAIAPALDDHVALPSADLQQMFASPSPDQTFTLDQTMTATEPSFDPFFNPAYTNGDWFNGSDHPFSQQFMDPMTCFDPNFNPTGFDQLQRSDSGIAFPAILSSSMADEDHKAMQGFGSMASMPSSMPNSPPMTASPPSNGNASSLYNRLTVMQYSVSRMRDQLDPSTEHGQQLCLDPAMFQLASSLLSMIRAALPGSNHESGDEAKAVEAHGFLLLMTVSAIVDAFETLARAIGARRQIRFDTQFSLGAFPLSDDGLGLDMALNMAHYYQRCFHVLLQRLSEQSRLEANAAGLLPKVSQRIEGVQSVTNSVREAISRDTRSLSSSPWPMGE